MDQGTMRYIATITYTRIYDEFETIDEVQSAIELEHPFVRAVQITGEHANPKDRQRIED
jgi:hypothetical protein